MKALNAKSENGLPQKGWAFGTFSARNVGGNAPRTGRKIAGWELKSPDGVIRACEGNWQQFVPFANMVLENYGMLTRIS